MAATTTLAGHPLHPILITFPAGLLPFSLIMDGVYTATGRQEHADTAYYALLGGCVGAMAAAAAGAVDYFAIPRGHAAARTANIHASMNVGLLALFGMNLLLRQQRESRSGRLPTLLSVVGNIGLLISAWYGGELVYKHGMRVKGVDPTAYAREIKPPGDELLDYAFKKAERPLSPPQP